MAWFDDKPYRLRMRGVAWLVGACLPIALDSGAAEFDCGVDRVEGLILRGAPSELVEREGVAVAATESSWSALGTKRLLIVRVDFEDLPGDPLSESAAVDLITRLHAYFREGSYGRFGVALPGHEAGAAPGSAVTATLRMPRAASDYGTNQLFQLLRADARSAAAEAGWGVEDYDLDLICMGRVPGFTWTGLGNIGSPGAWLRNQFTASVAAHELGHNLGLRHANAWDTAGQSVIGPGVEVEYGDLFDTMGTGGAEREFNVRAKAWLGWLASGEFLEAGSNGLYRIHAHDIGMDPGLARALAVSGSGGTNYWFEFRQSDGLETWSRLGAQLRWGFGGNQSTLLLDTTPGSRDGRIDAPLSIGRTFTDPALGLHVTALGLGGTIPESIDLMIHRGAFLTNRPPSISLGAAATNALVGQLLTWTALADDPNGDALAFHWNFGDGTFEGNRAVVDHAWTVPGEYVVRCEVSDMKGGRASDALIVRVGGGGGGYRVSGSIRAPDGQPVEGVRVAATLEIQSFTTSSGRYDLVGLPGGEYALQAVRYGFQVIPENFTNPVTVGPDIGEANFRAQPNWNQWLLPLVPAGSVWRYRDDGSDPGVAWKEFDYDDRLWEMGPAELGYGDGGEATVVDFGPFANNKPITTYFRHVFEVPDLTRIGRLTLGLLRDDGAVVYLNGREIVRSNMPEGRVDYRTRALSTVGSTAERTFYSAAVPPFHLRSGWNLLAVEVHQQDRDSSDLSFDLLLNAREVSSLPEIAILEYPREGELFRRSGEIMLFANAWAGPHAPIERVDFFADRIKVGQAVERPFADAWARPPSGVHELTARALVEGGLVLTSAPVRITVRDPLIPAGAEWKYFDRGIDLGSAWTQWDFDDAGWLSGPAELGYGDGDELTRVSFGENAGDKPITTYFRRGFWADRTRRYTNLVIRLLRDDGALVWLNGREQWRSNLPETGAVTFATRALEGIGDEEERVYHEWNLNPEALQDGRNVAAVEVHQRSPASSDISFDLELLGEGPGNGVKPRLDLAREKARIVISWWVQDESWRLMQAETWDGAWDAVAEMPEVFQGSNRLELDVGTGMRFFRLQRADP